MIPYKDVQDFFQKIDEIQTENQQMHQKLEELRYSRNCAATVGGTWW